LQILIFTTTELQIRRDGFAFGLHEEATIIREALSANVVTADIAQESKYYSTSEVGDWITQYIQKNKLNCHISPIF